MVIEKNRISRFLVYSHSKLKIKHPDKYKLLENLSQEMNLMFFDDINKLHSYLHNNKSKKYTRNNLIISFYPVLDNVSHSWVKNDYNYKNHDLRKHLENSLALGICDKPKDSKNAVYVNFLDPKLLARASRPNSEYLIKALKNKSQPHKKLNILDATCGMGVDSFLMFAQGHDVFGIEQNLLVYSMLKDGYDRFKLFCKSFSHLIQFCLEGSLVIKNENSNEYVHNYLRLKEHALNNIQYPNFDVVYLDPMFNIRNKNRALPNKKIQFLIKILLQTQPDDSPLISQKELCQNSYLIANKLIIKMNNNSLKILDKKPTYRIGSGKSCYFDVFLIQ